MLTAQYGNLRQGYNAYETVLTPANVQQYGLVQPSWSPLLVDYPPASLGVGTNNAIYAQPLYVAGMQVNGNSNCGSSPNWTCNMLVAVTQLGSIWAFNADTGKVIWNDCQSHDGITCAHAALWQEDCVSNTSSPGLAPYGPGPTGYQGILATPVIDPSQSPPVIYVTSLCQTANTIGDQQWWIHKINLTNGADAAKTQITATVPGYDGADNVYEGTITFPAWQSDQRAPLLEVDVPGATPSQLIYVTFAVGMISEDKEPYQGWVFAYDASLNKQFAFVTNAKGDLNGANTDLPSCTNGQPPPNSCQCTALQSDGSPNPACGAPPGGGFNCCTTGCIPTIGSTSYQWISNYCGHGAGIWASGKGPAARTDSNGKSHAYFTTGNGGFQQWRSDGKTLLNPILNWGGTVFDLTLSTNGFDVSPSQYFTPTGPVAVQPTVAQGGNTPICPSGAGLCNFEILSQNEFDFGVSGNLLFDDLGGNHRLVTIDKAGYGYLLTQGNLCGAKGGSGCYPGSASGAPGLAYGDPGNAFPFAANVTQCADGSDDKNCDRITSLPFANNSSPQRLYYWPIFERLTGLELSDNTQQTGTGTITISGTNVTGNGTSFTSTVIPGDILSVGGCAFPPGCPVITKVTDDTHLTISQGLTVAVTNASWSYAGYFVRPIYDVRPAAGVVEYPGASVEVTSNNGSNVVVWALANVTSSNVSTLFAYDGSLNALWWADSLPICNANVSYQNTTFALPTVVNGSVYVPTSGITFSSSQCPSGAPCSGLLAWQLNKQP